MEKQFGIGNIEKAVLNPTEASKVSHVGPAGLRSPNLDIRLQTFTTFVAGRMRLGPDRVLRKCVNYFESNTPLEALSPSWKASVYLDLAVAKSALGTFEPEYWQKAVDLRFNLVELHHRGLLPWHLSVLAADYNETQKIAFGFAWEMRDIVSVSGSQWMRSLANLHIGDLCMRFQRTLALQDMLERDIPPAQLDGSLPGLWSWRLHADLALANEQFDKAQKLYIQLLEHAQELQYTTFIQGARECLADLALARGDISSALRIIHELRAGWAPGDLVSIQAGQRYRQVFRRLCQHVLPQELPAPLLPKSREVVREAVVELYRSYFSGRSAGTGEGAGNHSNVVHLRPRLQES